MYAELTNFPASTENGEARSESYRSLSIEPATTSVVAYESAGRLLVIGAEHAPPGAIETLEAAELQCYLLIKQVVVIDEAADSLRDKFVTFQADHCEISGYLGSFTILVERNTRRFNLGKTAGIQSGCFDLVLEFSTAPTIPAEIPPPGYYWVPAEGANETQLQRAVEEIPAMVGNFQKPKYFNYNPDICAHNRSGITACTRCIDVCPTDAIKSIGELIEVDSYLCQGGGACSTACPTGAITYAYPPSANLLEILRHLILTYRQSGGTNAHILFFDQEHGKPLVQESFDSLSENILPVEVEEVGSLGLDVLFGLLAYGASGAIILCRNVAASVRTELKEQITILDAMMHGMGFEGSSIELLESNTVGTLSNLIRPFQSALKVDSAKFMPTGLKRTDIQFAVDHLHVHSPLKPESLLLPAHAPFGEIQVDVLTCTLCMGCVSVCPASALEAGGEVPLLSFIENNCVQCGMCEKSCPESSITRRQRYVFGADSRLRSKTLNEDAPFHCTKCGKPFASKAMLTRMKDKLKGHWMFTNPQAFARLEMCDECRVKDMFTEERNKFQDSN